MEDSSSHSDTVSQMLTLAAQALHRQRIDQHQFLGILKTLSQWQEIQRSQIQSVLSGNGPHNSTASSAINRTTQQASDVGITRREWSKLNVDQRTILQILSRNSRQYITAEELAEAVFGNRERTDEISSLVRTMKIKLRSYDWMSTSFERTAEGGCTSYAVV